MISYLLKFFLLLLLTLFLSTLGYAEDISSINDNEPSTLVETRLLQSKSSTQLGKQLFVTHCILCHGQFGKGDGRMAKLITNPPPFDLTSSRRSDAYLQEMIKKGGKSMGRSSQMPAWGGQLTDQEISILIEYLKSIRD